jgi:subtilisin family serine protease
LGNGYLDILGDYYLICAAAGNEGVGSGNFWPACHPKVLAVGAHQEDGHRADFGDGNYSNYQQYVRISAPGKNIWVPDMIGYTSNGYYRGFVDPVSVSFESFPWHGTSYASPIVAGAAALVLSTDQLLSPLQLKSRLLTTTKPLFQNEWHAPGIGGVDAYAAVTGGTP